MSKLPPPPGIWTRVERARGFLRWSKNKLGAEALGNRQGYNTIRAREWSCMPTTLDRIVERLVREGFNEAWLRMGQLPERGDGAPIPEEKSVLEKLELLARRLYRPKDEIIGLWGDLQGVGPLEKLPDKVQRAAFAAAYLEGRTLEDVRLAVKAAQLQVTSGAGMDDWLFQIRFALKAIKPGSGQRPALSLVPSKKDR